MGGCVRQRHTIPDDCPRGIGPRLGVLTLSVNRGPLPQMKHENTFQPLLLQHIRRYAALDASSPSNGPRRLLMRGLEAVQRNTMPLTVRLMTSTLRLLLERPDTTQAKDHVRKAVADLMADTQVRQSPHLMQNQKGERRLKRLSLSTLLLCELLGERRTLQTHLRHCSRLLDISLLQASVWIHLSCPACLPQDLHSLTMTRGLWRLGEYESRLPHVHLIERLESEDPRRHFRVGERVGYVLVQRDVGDQLYKKSEDPATALRRRLPLDLDEYLKQVGALLGAHSPEVDMACVGFLATVTGHLMDSRPARAPSHSPSWLC